MLHVGCHCFAPHVQVEEAVISCFWGHYPSLFLSDVSLLEQSAFLWQLEEGENLWDATGSCQGACLSGVRHLLASLLEVQTLKMCKCECRHTYIWVLSGGLWPCWTDSLHGGAGVCGTALCLLAGRFLQACLKANPSVWREAGVLPFLPVLAALVDHQK